MTLNLEQYAKLIDDEQKAFQADKAVKKVGYICNYIPVELLSAAVRAPVGLE